MTQQRIRMIILPDTSKSKGNQTKKFGQLIEYIIKNIFLAKSCTKYGGETSPRPFLKIEHISRSIAWIFIQFVFILCLSRGQQKHIETKVLPLVFSSYKAFLKNTKRLRTSLLALLLHDFWREIFLTLYPFSLRNVVVWMPLFFEISCNTFIVIVCVQL